MAYEGIQEMARVARPGVPESLVYAKVMSRILSLGSEYYPMAINSGPLDGWTYRHEDPHLGLVLGENWIIENEVDGVWGQLVAQEMQPMFLGPVPDKLKGVIELQRELYYAGLEYMTPGREFGDMIDDVNTCGKKQGMQTRIRSHGRGYGADGPWLARPGGRRRRSRASGTPPRGRPAARGAAREPAVLWCLRLAASSGYNRLGGSRRYLEGLQRRRPPPAPGRGPGGEVPQVQGR